MKIPKRELTKDDLIHNYKDYTTVGNLLKFINKNKIPMTARILVQRVEDVYYNEHGWSVYLKEGESCWDLRQWNKDIKNNEYLDEHPKLKEIKDTLEIFTEKQIKEAMEQYHPVWCPVLYNDDRNDFLFLDLHY